MFTLPQQPLNFLKLLFESLRFWKAHWRRLSIVALIVAVIGALPGLLTPRIVPHIKHISGAYLLQHGAYMLLFSFVLLVLFAFIMHQVYSIMHEEKPTIIQSFLLAFKKLPYLFIAFIIYNFVVFLGFALFFFPGLGFLIILSVYLPLIVVEKNGPISAFKESWNLATKPWFHIFLFLLVLTAAMLFISLGLSSWASDLWVLAHPLGGELPLGKRITTLFIDMLFFPIYISAFALLLHDLKLRQKLV